MIIQKFNNLNKNKSSLIQAQIQTSNLFSKDFQLCKKKQENKNLLM